MSPQQFATIQSQVLRLSPEQLMALQNQIQSKLSKEQESLLTDEEATFISSLFN